MIDIKNLPTLSLSFGGQNSSILILLSLIETSFDNIYLPKISLPPNKYIAKYIAIYFELGFQLFFIFGSLQ